LGEFNSPLFLLQGGSYMKCRVCGENITFKSVEEGRHIKITYNDKNYYFCCEEHCGQYMKQLKAMELYYKERDDIDIFVKQNIMFYKDNQKLPTYFFDRLADLNNGTDRGKEGDREVKNGERKGYPMPVILQTFKSQRDTILYWFRNKSFKNEKQKLNYMWKIIEGNINDEYEKWERLNRLEAKMKTTTVEQHEVDRIYNNDTDVVVLRPRKQLSQWMNLKSLSLIIK
jgi:YHS domain-containing protein